MKVRTRLTPLYQVPVKIVLREAEATRAAAVLNLLASIRRPVNTKTEQVSREATI
jgi:hypothetical protein